MRSSRYFSEKISNLAGHRINVRFQNKMPRIQQDNARVRNVVAECLCSRRDEEEIVAPPNSQQLRSLGAEEFLIQGIAVEVALIVELEVDLQGGIAGPGEDGCVESVRFRFNAGGVRHALKIG